MKQIVFLVLFGLLAWWPPKVAALMDNLQLKEKVIFYFPMAGAVVSSKAESLYFAVDANNLPYADFGAAA